jgi:hypothetical protein
MPASARNTLFVLVLAVGCGGSPPWPVPVPPEKAFDQRPGRAEAALPLCAGAATCPERDALMALVTAHAKRCTAVNATTSVASDVTALVAALGHGDLGTSEFPKSATGLPESFRKQPRHPALDARRDFPEGSAAVLYRGLWWTFWDRAVLSEVPRKAGGYTYLIVFPEFEGRASCGDDQ